KELPLNIKIGEVLVALSIIVYSFMMMGGGSFTTFYAMIGAVIIGVATAVMAVLKKKFILAVINLAVPAMIFLHFLSVA
ncbi:MAG: hypothetical protein RR309_07430, partial [Cellulosilyticaceae bacterium]